ncbi:MAG TPA: hypothetical protein VFU49_14755 [Ktedonobacteraceae bacterium]|nr:hypothetical protein [Ktedonobacteraceae bacterium]
MHEMIRPELPLRQRTIEFSHEERVQLDTIIDLLIPSDDNFPAPSSLPLIDVLLRHLLPSAENETALMLNQQRLRTVLRDLNIAAGGCFCKANLERQQILLKQLERKDPAFFQMLWTLANHSYYTHLATQRRATLS